VAYDVRGAGGSDAPAERRSYHLTELTHDLHAVIDAVSPARPVHLVGHDWGSVQAWDAVLGEPSVGPSPAAGARVSRIASLTSISGPCLDHVAALTRSARSAGWGLGSGGLEAKRRLFAQVLRSWYVLAFQIPRVADAAVRRLSESRLRTRRPGRSPVAPTLAVDAVNGLQLYRANLLRGEHRRGPREAATELPVLVVVPLRDRYVTPALTENVAQFTSDLTRVELNAGHWVMRSHPAEVAALIGDFVDAVEAMR
jgi:pimeloyl-ACP methyl ester carboxylesterase